MMKKQSDKALIAEYREYYDAIYVCECYGTSDLKRLSEIEKELFKRGYEINEITKVEVKKRCEPMI